MSIDIAEALVDMRRDEVIDEVRTQAEGGQNPLELVDECRKGMTQVGEKFQRGESFLAELVLSGEIFKGVLEVLDPYMKAQQGESKGKVVMATLKGDIHDLGKGIVATLLKAQGFEVHDLGVDVEPQKLIDAVKDLQPDLVGFSSLLTPNLQVMKQTVTLLAEEGLRDDLKVMIGGGVTTDQAREFVGADFQTIDASSGVEYCLSVVEGE